MAIAWPAVDPLQRLLTHSCEGHTGLHCPQFIGSVRGSTHAALHSISGSVQGGPQAKPPSTARQREFGAWHWVKQSPHWAGVLKGGMQTTSAASPPSPASPPSLTIT